MIKWYNYLRKPENAGVEDERSNAIYEQNESNIYYKVPKKFIEFWGC